MQQQFPSLKVTESQLGDSFSVADTSNKFGWRKKKKRGEGNKEGLIWKGEEGKGKEGRGKEGKREKGKRKGEGTNRHGSSS